MFYIVHKNPHHNKVYVCAKTGMTRGVVFYLEKDGALTNSPSKDPEVFHTFRDAIRCLKQKFPNIIRARVSIYGKIIQTRKYVFVDKNQPRIPDKR